MVGGPCPSMHWVRSGLRGVASPRRDPRHLIERERIYKPLPKCQTCSVEENWVNSPERNGHRVAGDMVGSSRDDPHVLTRRYAAGWSPSS
jgi:hypothetical protein